jgi:hypothetical protein
MAVSNLSVQQKTIDIKWSNALAMLIDLSGVSCGAPELTTSRKCSHNVTTNAKAFEKLLLENAVRIVEAIRTDDALDREPTSSQHTPSLPHVASKNLGNLRCRADMV